MRALVLLTCAWLFAGCAGSPAWYSMKISETRAEAERNNERMRELRIGQSRDEVLRVMAAPPTRTEAYRLAADRSVEFLFYRTKGWDANPWAASYGSAKVTDTDDQFTPVGLENGRVVGWGRNFYDQTIRVSVDVNKR